MKTLLATIGLWGAGGYLLLLLLRLGRRIYTVYRILTGRLTVRGMAKKRSEGFSNQDGAGPGSDCNEVA